MKESHHFLEHPLLTPYKEQILASKKSIIEMKLTPEKDLPLWQSKVGGSPYLPIGKNYPVNENGKPLALLIQINFEEIPPLEGYPEKGILQFFVDAQDELRGLDCENLLRQKGCRILEHNEVMQDNNLLQQDFPKIKEEDFYLPYDYGAKFSIAFEKKEQYIGISDYRFGEIIPNWFVNEELREILYDIDELNIMGHHIGGYPYFTQFDLRDSGNIPKDYELLLQLDSDEYLMWGDMGVSNFFIHPEDLKKADFSRVAYTWDCG